MEITANPRKSAQDAYQKWGVREDFDAADAHGMDNDALMRLLDRIEPKLAEHPYRLLPTSFDALDNEMRAYPYLSSPWPLCVRELARAHARGVILRTPQFWQMGFSVHAACREAGIPIFTNEPENVPVGALALERGGLDTVISQGSDASAFATYISAHGLPHPRLWILVHSASAGTWISPIPGAVRQVHLFPGVALLEQCPHLLAQASELFHPTDEFEIECANDMTLFSHKLSVPLPLWRYRAPFILAPRGSCTCGKDTFERI